jgi:hypothetical protein
LALLEALEVCNFVDGVGLHRVVVLRRGLLPKSLRM